MKQDKRMEALWYRARGASMKAVAVALNVERRQAYHLVSRGVSALDASDPREAYLRAKERGIFDASDEDADFVWVDGESVVRAAAAVTGFTIHELRDTLRRRKGEITRARRFVLRFLLRLDPTLSRNSAAKILGIDRSTWIKMDRVSPPEEPTPWEADLDGG